MHAELCLQAVLTIVLCFLSSRDACKPAAVILAHGTLLAHGVLPCIAGGMAAHSGTARTAVSAGSTTDTGSATARRRPGSVASHATTTSDDDTMSLQMHFRLVVLAEACTEFAAGCGWSLTFAVARGLAPSHVRIFTWITCQSCVFCMLRGCSLVSSAAVVLVCICMPKHVSVVILEWRAYRA